MGVQEDKGGIEEGGLKAERMEPFKGTWTVWKRAEEFFEGLLSEEEALAVAMGAYEEDSKKKN